MNTAQLVKPTVKNFDEVTFKSMIREISELEPIQDWEWDYENGIQFFFKKGEEQLELETARVDFKYYIDDEYWFRIQNIVWFDDWNVEHKVELTEEQYDELIGQLKEYIPNN